MTGAYATTTSDADWRCWRGSNVTVHEETLTLAQNDHSDGRDNHQPSERGRQVGRAIRRYDAGTAGTEWHRLRVRTSRPTTNTRVRARYLATDEPVETVPLETGAVRDRVETDVRLVPPETGEADETGDEGETKPSEVDGSLQFDHSCPEWTTLDVTGQADHRLTARGRYLYLVLELRGATDDAPSVESVRAFCDREPIRRHLPDLYDDSALLDDLLAVFETVFDDVEREIDGLTEYLDPMATPREALSWLESYVGIEDGEAWPESARRELLARAPELYRRRGTRAGLRQLVELHLRHASGATGASVLFLGGDDLDCIEDDGVRAAVAAALPEAADVVCYYEAPVPIDAVETAVDSETPAHVPTAAAPLEPSCSLDGATFLGHNSRLTRREFTLGETALRGDSTLEAGETERREQHEGCRTPTDRGEYR